MNSLWFAAGFLSVIRAPVQFNPESISPARSLLWFPVIGLALGALQVLLAQGADLMKVPAALQGLLLLMCGILFTGGLHLDGVADTADGFGAGSNRDSILRIMKDDRLGAFAVIGIVLVLYAKILGYNMVYHRKLWLGLLLIPAISRAIAALTILLFQYAREKGIASLFSSARYSVAGLSGILLSLFLAALINPALILFSIIFWISFQCYVQHKIAGYTGDTLGCLIEALETAQLFWIAC